MLNLITDPATWVSLLTLTAMEIVLGIDNIVFLTILAGKLPKAQQPKARRLGLALALGTRLLLLLAISWMMTLTRDLFSLFGHGFSGRDLILLAGGLFLLAKATFEIHDKLETQHTAEDVGVKKGAAFALVLTQIALLDVVFSLDSVITAVGMARHLSIMVAAMIVAVGVMLVFAGAIGEFVEKHPTLKILALSFLLLIGVMLVGESMGFHIPKGYVYFAMAFSLAVEMLNMRMLKKQKPVHLHSKFEADAGAK